jgi:hypothetical protein
MTPEQHSIPVEGEVSGMIHGYELAKYKDGKHVDHKLCGRDQ